MNIFGLKIIKQEDYNELQYELGRTKQRLDTQQAMREDNEENLRNLRDEKGVVSTFIGLLFDHAQFRNPETGRLMKSEDEAKIIPMLEDKIAELLPNRTKQEISKILEKYV